MGILPWRRLNVAAFAFAGSITLMNACGLIVSPPISCESITKADCQRAVAVAKPLLSAYWEGAGQIVVHAGACARFMHCPSTIANDQGYLMVELVGKPSLEPFVLIDRRRPTWIASCKGFRYSENTGQTKACQDS